MKKQLDYIFVDLDGTLLEGKYRHFNCYRDIVLKYGGNPLDINDYWKLKRNKTKRDVILKKSHFEGTYQDFFNDWLENIEKKNYLVFDKLKPKIKATLKKWRKISDQIVLITMRQSRKNLLWQLKKLGIIALFDEIILASIKEADSKFKSLSRFKFDRAVLIGDTEEEIKAAKLMKITSIAISTGIREKKYLAKADYLEEDISKINLFKLKI